MRVILHSGRPGVVIGKKGQEIETLKHELASMLKKNSIEISVQEVKSLNWMQCLLHKILQTNW